MLHAPLKAAEITDSRIINKSCHNNRSICGDLNTALKKKNAPASSVLDLPKNRNDEFTLPPCLQQLWRRCCNEAVCIMHEAAFRRHAAPNQVICCLLHFPSSLIFCTSFSEQMYSPEHLIHYIFCALLGCHCIWSSGGRKDQNVGSSSREASCWDKILYNNMLRLCVFVYLCLCS